VVLSHPYESTHPGIGRRVETKDGKGEGFLEEILTVKAELQEFFLKYLDVLPVLSNWVGYNPDISRLFSSLK